MLFIQIYVTLTMSKQYISIFLFYYIVKKFIDSDLKTNKYEELSWKRVIPKDQIWLLRGSLLRLITSKIKNWELEPESILDDYFEGELISLDKLFLMLTNLDQIFNKEQVNGFIKNTFNLFYNNDNEQKEMFLNILEYIKKFFLQMAGYGNPNSIKANNWNFSIQNIPQLLIALNISENRHFPRRRSNSENLIYAIDSALCNMSLDEIRTTSELWVLERMRIKVKDIFEDFDRKIQNEAEMVVKITQWDCPEYCSNPGIIMTFSDFGSLYEARLGKWILPPDKEKIEADRVYFEQIKKDYKEYCREFEIKKTKYTRYNEYVLMVQNEKQRRIEWKVSDNAEEYCNYLERLDLINSRIKQLKKMAQKNIWNAA